MDLTPSKINTYLLFKLPAAFLTGVRVKELSEDSCITGVKHRWINQNPFNSLFWAVQGMAAELSTGALVMAKTKNSTSDISMLVTGSRAEFLKKARGKITFSCTGGKVIDRSIKDALASGEGESFWMESVGRDSAGAVVSVFQFEWSIKIRPAK